MFKYYLFTGLLTVLVVGLIGVSLRLMGSPVDQKSMMEDSNTLSNVRELRYAIESYNSTNRQLPTKLEDVKQSRYNRSLETQNITYNVLSNNSYNLCAKFNSDSSSHKSASMYSYNYNDPEYAYTAGDYCFTFTVASYNQDSLHSIQTPSPSPTILENEVTLLESPKSIVEINPLNPTTFFDHECPGELVNGKCIMENCEYTYPVNLSKAGEVFHAGVVFKDTCSGNQIFKNACQSGDGGQTFGRTVQNFDCPYGCSNGACIE